MTASTSRRWFPLLTGMCLWTSLLPTARVAAAQTADTEQERVRSVVVEGNVELAQETILHYLGLRRGQPLEDAVLARGIRDLWETGLVDDVEVETFDEEDGVAVVVRIEERPRLLEVVFESLGKIRRDELEERRRDEGIELAEGGRLSIAEADRLRHLLEELHREKGYRFVEAEMEVERRSASSARVVFRVDEGERLRVGDVRFEGHAAFGDRRLRRAMKETLGGPFGGVFEPRRSSDAALHRDLDRVREVYRRAGFKDATVGPPKVERRGGELLVTVPVSEGERWRLGEITLEGNQTMSDERLLEALPEPPGPWLDARFVDRVRVTLEEGYRSRGHLYVSVSVETREREGGVADLRLRIREGDRYSVGRIELDGNQRTRDRVLRRQLRVQEGEVLDLVELRRGLAEVEGLEYFDLDAENPVLFDPDHERDTVDLTVRGQEADRTHLRFSGGWSRLEEISGRFTLRTPNFLGRGESLGLTVEGGSVRDGANLFYLMPWFLDRPQRLGVSLFRQDRRIGNGGTVSVAEEVGGRVSFGRSWGRSESLDLTLLRMDSLERVEGTDGGRRSELTTSSLRGLFVRDTRNDLLDPLRGSRLAATFEVAGGLLGGDRRFVRPELRFSRFEPLGWGDRAVLGFNVEAGWIVPYDGDRVSPLEGYFLGGPSSVRGFRPATIWTRDEEDEPILRDGLAVGGTRFLQLNLETQLVLRDPIRLVLFSDAGNVWGEDQAPRLSTLRTSAGVELRLGLPGLGAPLRFIYSWNLDPLPGDQFESFRIGFGTSF